LAPKLKLALLSLALAIAAGPVEGAAAVAIRTGGPSAPDEAKVAIVVGGSALAGSRFEVLRAGRTVMRGRLLAAAGSAAPWPRAYRADLTRLHRPGSYRVEAAGRLSRPWRISPQGSAGLIPHILRFFETNRDGALPALLHGPAHLNDAVVAGSGELHVDLTGGWMDAGDMLHFTQTTAYATMILEAAARLDPSHREELEREAAVGVEWLLKAHPTADLFVTQVGDGRDHDRGFADPAGDDSSGLPGIAQRVAYHWGTGVGGDIAGKVTAALAIAAEGRPEPERSDLLEQAREWYRAGRKAKRATPKLPDAGGFYVIGSWRDSLAAGAAALYRATGEASFLEQARRYLRGSDPSQVLGYADVAPFAAADVCGRLGARPLGRRPARRQACRCLRRNGRSIARDARREAFGLAGPAGWGTTSTNGAAGAIAALSGRRSIAAGARDYLLGRNQWGASFVAGTGPRSPRHISSWASVFGPGLPEGAVVGGPAPRPLLHDRGFEPAGRLARFDARLAYEDRRDDYVTSEPALDYAANSLLLLAALQQRGNRARDG
jgi:endoglucanase